MKFGQVAKRVSLLVVVNILVMLTITVVLTLLRVNRYFPQGGLAGLAVGCLVGGFAGSFISLAVSRVIAQTSMGVPVVAPETGEPSFFLRSETVHGLAPAAHRP